MVSTRRLSSPFWALSPFILVLGFGARSHPSVEKNHIFPEYSQAQRRFVENYQKLFQNFVKLTGGTAFSPKHSPKLMETWVAEFQNGEIGPIYPVFQDQESEDTAAQQIMIFWESQWEGLSQEAMSQIAAHNWNQACDDWCLCIKFLDSFKYSNCLSGNAANGIEIKAIEGFKTWDSHASASHQLALQQAVFGVSPMGADYRLRNKIADRNLQQAEQLSRAIRDKEGDPANAPSSLVSNEQDFNIERNTCRSELQNLAKQEYRLKMVRENFLGRTANSH